MKKGNRSRFWFRACLALMILSLFGGMNMAQAEVTPADLVVGPNGYYTPDYFGLTPNWAWTPLLTKFVDTLPGLWNPRDDVAPAKSIPLAVPDTRTYPGSDYYEIALREFSEVMHSELPATKLRGYVQVNNGTNLAGTAEDVTPAAIRYLGPTIVAQKDRPIRIKFINELPAGVGGKLFVPTDVTLMGAGPGPNATRNKPDDQICAGDTPLVYGATPDVCFTENRGVIHLHGGRTPWISDGTPHQWIIPGDDPNPLKEGASVEDVPDMWFDSSNVLADGTYATISACAGQLTCNVANATTDPGPGAQTYYYTNQQSARLLFYHDHAWGITRLNVYVGMAAGWLITDAKEEALIDAGTIPDNGSPDGVYRYGIPLIIQDKTFVDAGDLGAGISIPENYVMTTDPTWAWGSVPGKPVTPTPTSGDLWWPHVYMPAQNPYAGPGTNAFTAMGRWVYGPWFWPPTTNIEYPPIENPYFGAANPEQPPEMPATPNPSWGAEAFMDTPIVNGAAYPTVTVPAGKVRFRILNAAHDRFFNLQLYRAANKTSNTLPGGAPVFTGAVADLTEVAMVTASPTDGYPEFWPIDGREGGAPDPATRGPAIVQIGNEGGFLPKPVVLPNQPVNWNLDPTLFTAGLVLQQNQGGGTLMLGPAERADVIVDFSDFDGHTLILYNDAPAPWPALDPHYDYYTGGPDLRAEMGGPLTTLAGKGPNTRTIMQIVVGDGVSQTGAATPDYVDETGFNNLVTAFAGLATGAFATGQDPIIVGQGDFFGDGTYDAYDTAYEASFPTTWPTWGISTIYDTSLKFQNLSGEIKTIKMKAKAIQDEMGEVFDEYGRMSAKLGLELPFTTALNQTFVVQNFVDPATEIVYPNDIQIWKITHNGVDTHPVHFHLFDVQVLNRVGWDGFIELPDENELGWKETVRISPLQDTIVALRPIVPQAPFPVPNSYRPLNPAMPLNASMGFTNLDPLTAQALDPLTTNVLTNFGHEYVWHCHILSHEESDMMRPIILNTDQLLYVADATSGIQQWELGKWKSVNSAVPKDMVASGPIMYASVEGSGLWQWDGSVWIRFTSAVPTKMVASNGAVYVDLGANGLHVWDNSGVRTKISSSSPIDMVASNGALYFTIAAGLYKWESGSLTKLSSNVPTQMVASGKVLYYTLPTGLYKWESGVNSKLSKSVPTKMLASGAILYYTLPTGIYKSEGGVSTKINSNNPLDIAASGSALYYTIASGLYKWEGGVNTKLASSVPTKMVASGGALYHVVASGGLYKWEGGVRTKLSTTEPAIIVAGM